MAIDYDVSVRPIRNPQGKTVAFAQLIIDQVIQVDGFKIIDGSNGLFVSAPQHKGKNKEGEDTYFDDVRFLGDKPDGVYKTPLQEEIYELMVKRYQEQSVSNSRGSAASAQAATQGNPMAGNHKLWPVA